MATLRKCPECGKRGVSTQDVYPNGTNCLCCEKHIEVDTTFILLLIAALVILMFLDFHFYEFGVIGVTCAILLIIVGVGLRIIYPKFMPLRHYPEGLS